MATHRFTVGSHYNFRLHTEPTKTSAASIIKKYNIGKSAEPLSKIKK